MISLKGNKQSLCKKVNGHKWRALEEILACVATLDSSISNKSTLLKEVYNEAKLQRIADNSIRAKIGNYKTISGNGTFCNCNEYTKEVYNNYNALKTIYDDIFYNSWKKLDKKQLYPVIFEPHDVQLLFSESYLLSKYNSQLGLDIEYFKRKIKQYLQNIFTHVTPQHFVEHSNAIGLLDKIIIVGKDEAKTITDSMNPICLNDIPEYMGLFSASNSRMSIYFDKNCIPITLSNNDCIIFLCPENMDEMRNVLKMNHPTLQEMIDKVFSHEIGHLAFYFYWGDFIGDRENLYTIREKQANWISSLACNGRMDDLIEEVTTFQSSKYHNPVLLKHKSLLDYKGKVDGLYLR